MRHVALIPAEGNILDIACGRGRHLRALRGRGQLLVGIDIDLSTVADLRDAPGIELHALDIERDDAELPDAQYAGIIVTNYLCRPLLPRLADHLSPGGALIVETFAAGNEAFGKPSNPDYLLEADELLNIFTPLLRIEAFEQGYTDTPKPAIMQRICAIRTV